MVIIIACLLGARFYAGKMLKQVQHDKKTIGARFYVGEMLKRVPHDKKQLAQGSTPARC